VTERNDADALSRARAAALAELRAAPAPASWRRHALLVAAGFVATSALAACAMALAGAADPALVAARAAWLGSLAALGALAGVAALAPRGAPARAAVLLAAPALMAALALSRGAGLPSETPEWVCSVSHLGLGLLPLGVALWGLRQAAWRPTRAVAAGLGAGTAGAFLGELACHRGTTHVLVHHVGAWLVVVAACVLVSRNLKPRTFAP
jgi:hypothetical protein